MAMAVTTGVSLLALFPGHHTASLCLLAVCKCVGRRPEIWSRAMTLGRQRVDT